MPFEVVGRVRPKMCSLVKRPIDCHTRRGNFWVDMGRPIITNGGSVLLLCENV